jgi:glycosyltransferase involved in cell wall biosynthesis
MKVSNVDCRVLALGTPVVAVDCNSGPREIVIDEYNGLLVETIMLLISQLPLTV